MTISNFIKKRPYLVWGTRNYDNLSEEAIVENVLNYGDIDDVKEMFSILGVKKSAIIFKKQMHKEILTEQQTKLLPLIGKFSKDFGLVGGTAISLHTGHRESIDFDLLQMILILRKYL